MSTLASAKQQLINWLRAQLPGAPMEPSDLTMPPNPELGDLAFGCFAAAKAMKKSPVQIASELASAFARTALVDAAAAAGPYVNFTFDRAAFASSVLRDALADPAPTATGKRVMIEYINANTHKEFHVGHLRNACLGIAVVNLCRESGLEVIPVNYVGDIGAHVAKCLWALKKFHGGETPTGNRGKYLGEIYAEATRRVDEDESLKEEVAAVQRKLEARDPEWDALWQETRQWSIDEHGAIFAELGATFDRIYYESEVEERGKELVRELLDRGIAVPGERGAVIVNLEDEGLGVFLVRKSDGSALYSTKELALAEVKFGEHDVDESIIVVDARQSLYFKQFFATLRRMGFQKKMVHLAYEFVTLAEGAMSSRKGNIIAYEDFRDEVIAHAAEETRKRREEWDERKVMDAAKAIAFGAMKFGMLKQDPDKTIVFDVAQAISFDGFTGPYVQYAHTRMSSILQKAGSVADARSPAVSDGIGAGEFAVLRKAADLPETIAAAAAAFKPSVLAQYLFELAQAANDFYRDVPVLSADGKDKPRRLAIVASVMASLSRGLAILGIPAPDEM